jgi:hypothetical protein
MARYFMQCTFMKQVVFVLKERAAVNIYIYIYIYEATKDLGY